MRATPSYDLGGIAQAIDFGTLYLLTKFGTLRGSGRPRRCCQLRRLMSYGLIADFDPPFVQIANWCVRASRGVGRLSNLEVIS